MGASAAVLSSVWLVVSMIQAAPAGQAAPTGRVGGIVTIEGGNTPAAGARVMLMPTRPPAIPMSPMRMPPQTVTGEDGRFVFERVLPGTYRIEVQKTGFAPLGEPGREPTAEVSAGQTTEIALHLQKGAVIAGKILDAAGEPVADLRIMAMHHVNVGLAGQGPAGAVSVRFFPAPGAGQQTNDLGEFRLAGLAPGEYYVAAMPRGNFAFGGPGMVPPTTNPPGTATTTTATTYYPGTIDQATAHPIKVAAGETVNNIVFSVQSVPSFRISGRVVDENGAAVAGAMVMLMGDAQGHVFMGPAGSARSGEDGRFTIADVPSGTYRLNGSVPIMVTGPGGAVSGGTVTAMRSGSVSTWSSSTSSGGMTGMDQPTEVTVNGANVTGVRVVVKRPTPQ